MKLTQNYLFQAQASALVVPEDLNKDQLPFFKAHTLPKHLKCFKKWQKLRCSNLFEITRVTDHPTRRARAFDLENYVHAMFPTEQYAFATLMNKNFIKEVAHKFIETFEKADGQTRMEMAFKPILPKSLQCIPSEQEEVNGQLVTLPEVINLVSEDEEETDENNFEEPPSDHHKDDNDKKDDDDAPAPGTGGIAQGNNASVAKKHTERTSQKSPPPSTQKSTHPSSQ